MLLISIVLASFNNCTNHTSDSTILYDLYLNQAYNVSKDSISLMNKTYRLFSNINSSAFINDTKYLFKASNSTTLDIFSTQGENIDYIELTNCNVSSSLSWPIKVYNDSIYVWCESRSIIQVFDNNLSKVNEIYCPKTKSIRDFIVNENLVIFYNKINADHLISLYNRSSGNYIFETGKPTKEHQVMEQSINAGGMALRDNSLFYCRADCLNIHIINLNSFEEDVIKITAPEFTVSNYPVQNFDSQIDFNQAYRYKATNSNVTGLFLVKNELMIISEVGTYTYKNPSGEIFYDNRYFLFLSYDYEKGIKKSLLKIKDPMQSSDFVDFFTNGSDLFSISPTFSTNNDWVFLFSKLSMNSVGETNQQ
jgi:hypothetical protein